MSTNANMLPLIPFLDDLPAVLSVDCPSVVADEKTPATIAALRDLADISSSPNVHIHSISPKTTDELVRAGMTRDHILELGNGVDVDYFRPVANAKRDVCLEFGLPEGTVLIGGAGRHSEDDKSKDIPNILYAAAALKKENPGLYDKCAFMVCGKGTADGDLHELSQSLGIEDKVLILGARHDMPRLYSAWTISNICSLYEPFGLVLPEAMACETICVATNVDMLPQILSGHGLLVDPADALARAKAWEDILSMPQSRRSEMAAAARVHVENHYNGRIVNMEYAALYSRLASQSIRPSFDAELQPRQNDVPLFGGLSFGRDGIMLSACP
jgi:glycosyltransferase involved in cell wall biosynthesis